MDGEPREASGFSVLNADAAALEALEALEKECFTLPWSVDSFAFALRHPELFFLPAVYDGDRLVGYAVLCCLFETAELQNIAVRKEYRGGGLGEKLLGLCLSEARKRNAEKILLEVRRSNAPALHLYEKAGFAVSGVRKNYYRQPLEDALIMAKDLTKN